MKCPACETLLAMTERQGVEIDYCPSCRGMWLERGELDKLIERARREEDLRREEYVRGGEYPRRDDYARRELEDSDDRRPALGGNYDRSRQAKPYRKSFWSELFDFD